MRRRLAWSVPIGLLLLAVVQQLALPPLAERRLRERLERTGTVERVEVRAWPAIQLLWGDADAVEVVLRRSTQGAQGLADQLAATAATDELDAHARELRVGPLALRDARLTKRGRSLRGEASLSRRDLRAVLPRGFEVYPVTSRDGRLVFEGRVRVLGRLARAQVVLVAEGGRLMLAPAVPFGGVLAVAAFADPRIQVEHVGARATPDGFVLTGRGRLVQPD